MTELTGGVIPGMFQKQYDIKRGYPILQVRFLLMFRKPRIK